MKDYVFGFMAMGLVLILITWRYRAVIYKTKDVALPDKGISLRNIVELIGGLLLNQCRSILGEKYAERYFPLISSIFFIVLLLNLIGLVPGFLPPTDQLNTTAAFSVFVFIYYNWQGIKEVGFFNYLKHFAGPIWYMAVIIFPLEILSNIIRPLTLSLRLRGNIFGDHMMLNAFMDLAPVLVPVPFYFLGLIVCLIQAYVFALLTMVYISLAINHEDENHGAEKVH